MDDAFEDNEEFVPWDETCDCCGKVQSIEHMVAEEGDRWECFECWDRLNEKERIERGIPTRQTTVN